MCLPHRLSENGMVWELGGSRPERFTSLEAVVEAAEIKAPKLTTAYWDALTCGEYLGWITPYQAESDAAIARVSHRVRLERLKAKAREADAMRDEFRKMRLETEKKQKSWMKTLKAERW